MLLHSMEEQQLCPKRDEFHVVITNHYGSPAAV